MTSPGPETQELRLATAMTGGASLAIWMGGVARELNLLQHASRQRETAGEQSGASDRVIGAPATADGRVEELYLRLLELLDTTVAIDVLVGTSAGGINAALLGLVRVNDLDLGRLRDVWLEVGGFEELLRDPAEHDLPSLLQGDGVLLDGLTRGIEAVWPGAEDNTSATLPQTRVFMTTTLLAGETSRFTDAFGTLVQDIDHQGMFSFDQDDLARRDTTRALATAGRSSSSYPLAFEPGFVSWGGEPERPAMAYFSNITRSHWVADGGLMMNRPINPLLHEIFDREAERQVRRVVLYVVPSSGEDPDPTALANAAELTDPLTLPKALMKDVGAVISQSIAADLRAFREHNERVDALVDTRLRMAELGVRLGERLLSPEMLHDYAVRQSARLLRPLVAALMRKVTTLPPEDLPDAWASELTPGQSIEQRCQRAAAAMVWSRWMGPAVAGAAPGYETIGSSGLAAHSALPTSGPGAVEAVARYGPDALEGAKAMVIAMLRAAFVLTDPPGPALDRTREALQAAAREDRKELGKALASVHQALRFKRPKIQQLVDEVVRAELPAAESDSPSAAGGSPGGLEQVARTVTATYQDRLPSTQVLSEAWSTLARVLRDQRELLLRLAGDGRSAPQRQMSLRDRAAAELRTYLGYLGTATDVPPIAVLLFDLHVATRSVLPASVGVEQAIELVQLSADTRTLLDGRTTAQQKLTGMQLSHFGAFYKSSWRASDWAWGRVDGAGWLVHLLLDPRRIRSIIERQYREDSQKTKAAWFRDRLRNDVLSLTGPMAAAEDPPPGVNTELAFLDAPAGAQDPTSLPETALWMARTWQRWIAAAELPVVAEQMVLSSSRPDSWATDVLALVHPAATAHTASVVANRLAESSPMRRWAFGQAQGAATAATELTARTDVTANLSSEDAVRFGDLLATCPVPNEKIEGQLGQPLFTRTVTKLAAVTAGILDGVPRVAPLLGSVLTTLRTLTLAGYRAATATGGRSQPLLVIGLVCVALGVMAAISNSGILGITGIPLTAFGIAMCALTSWGWRRRRAWTAAAGGVVIAGILYASFPGRDVIFGNGQCEPKDCKPSTLGWVGTDALPWLAAKPWHVLLIVIAFAVAVGVAGASFRFKRRTPRSAAVVARD